MLYDLTTLQREANNRYGFSAKRTLAAAQRLYEEHKALTYPRTNSRYLTTDLIAEIKPIAELLGARPEYRAAAEYVTGLDLLPLARVVNDEKVSDHHAIIPTRSEHPVEKMGSDDQRIYDMAVRRFLAVFHPEAVFENTKVETTVLAAPLVGTDDSNGSAGDGGAEASYVFRTRGRCCSSRAGAASTTRSRPTQRPTASPAARTTTTPSSSSTAHPGRGRSDPLDRERAQGNQTAAALLGRLAPRRHGDRRQARRRRRAA